MQALTTLRVRLTLVVARMATDDVVGMTKLNLRENPGFQIDREALAVLQEAAPARRTRILADEVSRPRNGVFMTVAFNQVTLARQALD